MTWRRMLAALGTALALAAAEEPASAAVTGACHASPVVADLDRSVRFYRDLLGLQLVQAPGGGPIPWDARAGLLDLHGLSKGRVRTATLVVPGTQCGVEPIEFSVDGRAAVRPRMQDAGAVTLILLVRDLDAAFARLKKASVPVVTTGGAPVLPSPTSRSRAVIVRDPDGHFVELAQLEPPPATAVPASSNVFDIRFRVTVRDVDQSAQYYRERLGISAKPGAFATGPGVMAMMGLPGAAEYRLGVTPIPGSTLILEFLEIRGLDRSEIRPRIQDPGAYRLPLDVDDLDGTLASLSASGTQVISKAGAPVRMELDRPGRLAAVQDPNQLFLVLRQGPLP